MARVFLHLFSLPSMYASACRSLVRAKPQHVALTTPSPRSTPFPAHLRTPLQRVTLASAASGSQARRVALASLSAAGLACLWASTRFFRGAGEAGPPANCLSDTARA